MDHMAREFVARSFLEHGAQGTWAYFAKYKCRASRQTVCSSSLFLPPGPYTNHDELVQALWAWEHMRFISGSFDMVS